MPRIYAGDDLEFELMFDPQVGGTLRLRTHEVDAQRRYTFRAWVDGDLYEWRNLRAQRDGDGVIFTFEPKNRE